MNRKQSIFVDFRFSRNKTTRAQFGGTDVYLENSVHSQSSQISHNFKPSIKTNQTQKQPTTFESSFGDYTKLIPRTMMTMRSLPVLIITLMITSTWGQGHYDPINRILQGAVATQNTTTATSDNRNETDTTLVTLDDTKTDTSPVLDSLFEEYAEYREHNKMFTIIRSLSGLISIIASSVLIWIVLKSKNRLSTSYQRIILGMGISDVLWSAVFANFNLFTPKDLNYMVWNARGNQASCTTVGFLCLIGMLGTLLYSCSLNLYYLAIVRHNRKDNYISSKLDKWFHGVPIVFGLFTSTVLIFTKNINSDRSGVCTHLEYIRIPHCFGFEDGDVPEGFEVPCGRGTGSWGKVLFYVVYYAAMFCTPVIILGSLGIMYTYVKKQEIRMARYGVGALNIETPDIATEKTSKVSSSAISSIRSSVTSAIMKPFGCCWSSNNQQSKSKHLLNRAVMYSISYFITWIWMFIINIYLLAKKAPPVFILYLWAIFGPLQGIFTLMIYMQPKVMQAKQGKDISWCSAIAEAFRMESSGSKSSTRSRGKKLQGAPRKIAMGPTPSPNQNEVNEAISRPENTGVESPGKSLTDNLEQGMEMNNSSIPLENSSMPLEKSNSLWLKVIDTNEQSNLNSTASATA